MEADQNLPSRKVQQIGGLLILLIGLGFTFWTWYTAFYQNHFYPKAAMIFPLFFFVGLGLLLFPDYKTERIARGEDISELSGMKLLTARWWAILVVGLLAGFANYLLIRFL